MKYNKSVIMKRAWEIKKSGENYIFAFCLKMAWDEAKHSKKERFGMSATIDGGDVRYYFKNWKGRRIYISEYKKDNNKRKDCGYIDIATGEYIYKYQIDTYMMAVDEFCKTYEFAA